MTPVFCCGFECGVTGAGAHWAATSGGSFSTSTVRSGSRSIRINTSASNITQLTNALTSSNICVARVYIRFATLPSADCCLIRVRATTAGTDVGILFKQSDSKLYPGKAQGLVLTFGAAGATVTTDVWYRVDLKIVMSANPWTVDVQLDGTSVTQYTNAVAADAFTVFCVGAANGANTADIFYDDVVLSNTSGDYPIGAGYVNHFVPTSDGTHNVAGANDFEFSNTGTDITNATTTAYTLIDDVPLKSGVISEYINLIAPANSTDYVEVVFGPAPGIPTPTTAPRTVEAIICISKGTGTGANALAVSLFDNGSGVSIFNGDVATITTNPNAGYARKNYTDPPSAASVWVIGGGGNGDFTNVRMRCFSSDPAPDPWWASAMIEAEFQEIAVIPNKIFQVKQAVNRAGTY